MGSTKDHTLTLCYFDTNVLNDGQQHSYKKLCSSYWVCTNHQVNVQPRFFKTAKGCSCYAVHQNILQTYLLKKLEMSPMLPFLFIFGMYCKPVQLL